MIDKVGGVILKDKKILVQRKKNNREECIIPGGKREGNDVTENFERGAIEVLKLAKSLNINKAILQPRSPSCGVNKIYSGNFDNKLIDGNGILADLLIENGIEVFTPDEI